MTGTPIRVFISYKWEDELHNQWVEKLARDLRLAGLDALLDRWEVLLGDSFTEYMASRIAEADVFLFIMTTRSVQAVEAPKGKGGALKFEFEMAKARQIAGENVRLIGIYREGTGPPVHLRDRRYADFRDDTKYDSNLRHLIADLKGSSAKPPLGQTVKKLSPTEQKIKDLKKKFEDVRSEWLDYNYRHMDADDQRDYSQTISSLRKAMQIIQAEIRDLGGDPPDF